MREAHRKALAVCLTWYRRASYGSRYSRAEFAADAGWVEEHCRKLDHLGVLPWPASGRVRACAGLAYDALTARNVERAVTQLQSACDALHAVEGIDRTAFAAMLVGASQKHVP